MTRTIDIRDADLVAWSAQTITDYVAESLRLRGRMTLVLAGGSTPREVYALLATEHFRARVDWEKIMVFWGDERCVAPDHPESNYRMAREAMLAHVPIPDSHIFRIRSELTPEEAAQDYEDTIRRQLNVREGAFPRFDLVLLGLGEDGHTASLFPDTTGLREEQRLVTSLYVRRLNTHRITMTFPTINSAARVLFMVSGPGKSGIVQKVLEGSAELFPSQQIKPDGDGLHWILDREAAASLQHTTQKK